MKKKKRSAAVTILINFLFIAAIAVVGWKIYDYVSDSRQATELTDNLWEEAVITADPAAKKTVQTTAEPEAKTAREPAKTEPETQTAQELAEERTENRSAKESPKAKAEEPQNAEASEGGEPARQQTEAQTAEATEQQAEAMTTEARTAETGTAQQQAEIGSEGENPAATPAPNGQKTVSGEGGSVFLDLINATATPQPTPRFTDAPDLPEAMDFEKLKKRNSDVAGWLYQPEIKMNLPVMHTTDNEFYLRRGFDRYTRKAGSLFIDYRNKGDFSDRNTIIYGHGRRDLTMFGRLHFYKEADYCEAHPFLYLYVPGHRYRLEIVATGYTHDASDYYDLPADKYWDELLDRLMEQSPYDFGIPISPDDHYVTLSTCAYDYQNERWLVIARIDDPEGTLPEPSF